MVYFVLQVRQEPPGMGAVHLCVVKLEGDGQLISKPFSVLIQFSYVDNHRDKVYINASGAFPFSWPA